jgi:peptidyl-prolyl cis-trans isomerase C
MNSLLLPGTSTPHAVPARRLMFAVVFSAASVFASAGPSFGQEPASDALVAKVDDVEIRQSDIALADEALGRNLPEQDERSRRNYLIRYLSDMIILSQAAQKQNLADEVELRRRIEFTRNKALMETLLQVTARTAVTDEAVRKAYDDAVQKSGSETELHLRGILFLFKDAQDEAAVKAAESKAREAVKRIAEGEDFAAVAKALTESPSSKFNGGDLGYMTRGQMGSELAEAAFKLDDGGVSEPIKTKFGWHILKVEGRRTRKPAEFDAVRDKIEAFVARKAQFDLIASLRSEAKVELFERLDAAETPTAPEEPAEGEKSAVAEKPAEAAK